MSLESVGPRGRGPAKREMTCSRKRRRNDSPLDIEASPSDCPSPSQPTQPASSCSCPCHSSAGDGDFVICSCSCGASLTPVNRRQERRGHYFAKRGYPRGDPPPEKRSEAVSTSVSAVPAQLPFADFLALRDGGEASTDSESEPERVTSEHAAAAAAAEASKDPWLAERVENRRRKAAAMRSLERW
eukprot:RCo040245